MRLVGLEVRHFRSIGSAAIDDCNGFNVLIGKNNAGKSNVLVALGAFFACLSSGAIVNLKPPLGGDILDFHYKDAGQPVEIGARFALSLAERDALLRDVVTEFPQMQNAVDGIDPRLQLSVHVCIAIVDRKPASYIRQVSLVRPGPTGSTSHVFLDIGMDAAAERIDMARKVEDVEFEINVLQRAANSGHLEEQVRYYSEAGRRPPRYSYPPLVESVMTDIPSADRARVHRILDRYLSQMRNYEALSGTLAERLSSLEATLSGLRNGPKKRSISTFSGESLDTPRYIEALVQSIISIRVLHLTERRKQIGREEAAQLLDLKVRRGGPEILRTIQETVSALMGVSIDAFRAEGTSRNETAAELDVDNFLVQANGSGIREALRVVLDYELTRPAILLVEEPEVHLHPALEVAVMRYLKRISFDAQVFITTHSTNFLDMAEMRNVYLVGKGQCGTTLERLCIEDAETEIPRELGIRLSSLFMYDTLVFVEGPSDEAIIRELAAVMSVNLSEANVGFVALGGVGNFRHYAAESILNFLSRRQVKIRFILDRDERDDAEVASLKSRLDGQMLHVLTRRELENYLLVPEAIASLINEKIPSTTSPERIVSVDDVTAALDEAAEGLRQLAVNLRVQRITCKPIYPKSWTSDADASVGDRLVQQLDQLGDEVRSRRESVTQLVETYGAEVETRWDSDKLNIVPGSVLLDRVLATFGLRYKKERDGSALASKIRPPDLPMELANLIRSM